MAESLIQFHLHIQGQSLTIQDLHEFTGLSRPTISNHVKRMEKEGKVSISKKGNCNFVSLSAPKPVQKYARFGELFCGPGGMGYGLSQAGFTPKWAIDIDPNACDTYAANVGGHAINKPVEDVNFDELDEVDGLAFGFPCNDFSMVGEKLGTGGYFGMLYTHSICALEATKPAWFIAENVPGLLTINGTEILEKFANTGPGYKVTVHQYGMEKYGVAQKRTRVIAVGIRKDLNIEFQVPAPNEDRPISVGQAFNGVADAKFNNEYSRHKPKTVEMLQSIPEGQNAWYAGVPEHLRLNVPNVRMSMIYRRLREGEPSYTVTGSGGGGTHMYHWKEDRALTNRERARIQSFPDTYEFKGGREAVRKQIGMAVPPLGAKVIGDALNKSLRGEEFESIAPSVGVLEPMELGVDSKTVVEVVA